MEQCRALDALTAVARGRAGKPLFEQDRLRLSRLTLSPTPTCG